MAGNADAEAKREFLAWRNGDSIPSAHKECLRAARVHESVKWTLLEGGPFKPFFGLSGAVAGGYYLEKKRGSSKSPHNENRVVWATRGGL